MEHTFYIVVVETDITSRLCNLKSESERTRSGVVHRHISSYMFGVHLASTKKVQKMMIEFLHVWGTLGQYQKNSKNDEEKGCQNGADAF